MSKIDLDSYASMLARSFILLVGPPKSDRLKGRGQTKEQSDRLKGRGQTG